MAIPDYQTLMLPVLEIVRDGGEYSVRDVIEQLAGRFKLTDDERHQLLPGGQATFNNRVQWAKSYLTQAKLLQSTRRGRFQITDRGQQALAGNPTRIDNDFLQTFPEFVAFRRRSAVVADPAVSPVPENGSLITTAAQTPDELLRSTMQQIEATLRKDLLDRVTAASASFFERLIVTLLLAMGYGGAREEAGKVVGRTGDGGIDGVIDQDRLGLDRVYIQAKKYGPENAVSEPEIRAFSGSLGAAKANKGVFVTTSYFTQPAQSFAERHPFRIVLIDGEELAGLMLRHNVGARVDQTLYLKKLDEDFFSES
jgi:restriction system protein